jgi:hypothetical protein
LTETQLSNVSSFQKDRIGFDRLRADRMIVQSENMIICRFEKLCLPIRFALLALSTLLDIHMTEMFRKHEFADVIPTLIMCVDVHRHHFGATKVDRRSPFPRTVNCFGRNVACPHVEVLV